MKLGHEMGQIAYFTPGLRALEQEIRLLSGLEPRFCFASTGSAVAVAGWGHKPTAGRARRIAKANRLPYLAFEDGFLRSVEPGASEKPVSMVLDRAGIFYDAREPSDLEVILETADFDADELNRAGDLQAFIRKDRLSKYNHGPERDLAEFRTSKKLVLLIDQTFGDASVKGSLSTAETFERMAEAARFENPDALIIAKLHPETVRGTKRGYLPAVAKRLGFTIFTEPVSPWSLLDLRPHVYTVSSQFGFEALIEGCKVTCFGVPFYAGWGLTDDRSAIPDRRRRVRNSRELGAAVYLRYAKYFDCWRRTPVSAEVAVDQLAFLRRSYLANNKPVIGYRIARWKRPSISAMLWGPHGRPRFTSSLAKAIDLAQKSNASVAAWGAEAIRLRPVFAARGISCIAIEDGFLRSVGLGAAFVQPLSLVFDHTGLYYDSRSPSDLENMLSRSEDLQDDSKRAAALRDRIVRERITKYNLRSLHPLPDLSANTGQQIVVVPGQVADDWAVRLGRPAAFPADRNVNALLLHEARAAHPASFIVFKPHPDVERLGRAGRLTGRELDLADAVVHDVPLDDLLIRADRVEAYSSLAGFEALLRGLPVTVYGQPFYAGWGLTEDRNPPARRGHKRTLNELVAAALIRYPRYWDPVSRLPCTPEMALERLGQPAVARPVVSYLQAKLGQMVIWSKGLTRKLKDPVDEC